MMSRETRVRSARLVGGLGELFEGMGLAVDDAVSLLGSRRGVKCPAEKLRGCAVYHRSGITTRDGKPVPANGD